MFVVDGIFYSNILFRNQYSRKWGVLQSFLYLQRVIVTEPQLINTFSSVLGSEIAVVCDCKYSTTLIKWSIIKCFFASSKLASTIVIYDKMHLYLFAILRTTSGYSRGGSTWFSPCCWFISGSLPSTLPFITSSLINAYQVRFHYLKAVAVVSVVAAAVEQAGHFLHSFPPPLLEFRSYVLTS